MAPYNNPTDTIIASLTDRGRVDIARLHLGRCAFKFSGWDVGRDGYKDEDPTKVDPLVTSDIELGDQIYPAKYPSDLIALAQYNDAITPSFNLDYVRDGGALTGAATGSAAIVTADPKFGRGNLALVGGVANVTYGGANVIDAAVQTGCVECWVNTNYDTSPSATQYFVVQSQASGNNTNLVSVYHTAGGLLGLAVYSSLAAQIVNITGSWSPTSGVWTHLSGNWDVTAGASRLFAGGTQIGATSAVTGTRSGSSQWLATGRTTTTSPVSAFNIDEIAIYDAVQRTGTFTPPTVEQGTTKLSFLQFDIPLPNTVAPVCRLLPTEALYGLGELGIWVEVTTDTEEPLRVGEKYLFAVAHFPLHSKTLLETTVWRVIFAL